MAVSRKNLKDWLRTQDRLEDAIKQAHRREGDFYTLPKERYRYMVTPLIELCEKYNGTERGYKALVELIELLEVLKEV